MALVEQYANLAQDTLNGGINNSTVTVVLNDASEFPSTGNFRVLVDSELMLCTARSSNTLTVTRGIEGTSAASHNDLATATLVATAGAIPELFARHGMVVRRTPLFAADFTVQNAASSTLTDKNGILAQRTPTGSVSLTSYLKSLPGTPWKITAPVWFNRVGNNVDCGGLILRSSGDSKLSTIAFCGSGTVEFQKWTNDTTFSALYTSITLIDRYSKPLWMQIEDNGSNRFYRISQDGVDWTTAVTVGNTDFHTPNQYGIFINREGTGGDRLLTVFDLYVE
jgi:hypothetical protein